MQEMKFISFFFLKIDIDLVSIKSAWLFSQEQVQLFLLHAYSSIKKILIIVWTLFNWKLSQWKILVQYHILFVKLASTPLGELLCCWRLYYIKTDPLNSKFHTILKLLIFCMVGKVGFGPCCPTFMSCSWEEIGGAGLFNFHFPPVSLIQQPPVEGGVAYYRANSYSPNFLWPRMSMKINCIFSGEMSYCKFWIYWVGVDTKFSIWQFVIL